MDPWSDLIGDLWPPATAEAEATIRYLRKWVNAADLRRAATFALASDLGGNAAAALQAAWDEHYRFTWVMAAPLVYSPEDPAQWFVDLGLNSDAAKARTVLVNIAIVRRRVGHVARLISGRPESDTPLDDLLRELIKIHAFPSWQLARWAFIVAAALMEAGEMTSASQLLRELKGEPLSLLQSYVRAMEQLTAGARQAVTEAMERPPGHD